MKPDKRQKQILIFLLILCILTPIGILLPAVFNTGDAWGEWSAQTLKELVGYVPSGMARYGEIWKAPISDYTLTGNNPSLGHSSGFYIVSGVFGAAISYGLMLFISFLIVKNEK